MTDLRPETLTWTALLGRWVEFAQASVALPDDGDGRRWRSSVADIVRIQAVTFALAELARLASADRPLARDRADLLIAQSVEHLRSTWRSVPMPPSLLEMGDDARLALEMSAYAGSTELFWPGPETMIMPQVTPPQPRGSLAVMQPGTIVMPGEPVAWWSDREGIELRGCETREVWPPRQVYRCVDEAGRIVEDVVLPISEPVPAGLPLLVPLFDGGRAVGEFTMEADSWRQRQQAAMPGGRVPVVERWR